MALDPVCKVEITAHNSIIDPLLDELQALSVIQIDPHGIEQWESDRKRIRETGERITEMRREQTEIEKAASFLDVYTPRVSILQKLSMQPDEFTKDELMLFSQKEDVQTIKEKALNVEKALADVENKIRELKAGIGDMVPLLDLRVPLSTVGSGTSVKTIISKLEPEAFERLETEADSPLLLVERISGGEEASSGGAELDVEDEDGLLSTVKKPGAEVYFSLVFHRDAAETINQLEKKYRFEPLSYPVVGRTPREIVRSHLVKIRELTETKKTLQAHAVEVAKDIKALHVYSDYLETELEKENAKERFFYTEKVFVIHGWLEKRDIPVLQEVIDRYTEAHINQIEKERDEIPPVAYRNNNLVSPFEIIVNLYSPPNHREIDPTPILAPFYALFFGICLTEAGYGLVIAIISLIGMHLIKTNNGFKKFLRLFLILGVSTFVIGALIGTVFGINFDLLPEKLAWLREARYKIMIFDSGKDVLTFFSMSLALGVLHLITGYIIKIYMLVRDGEWVEAVCDHLPWIFLLLAPVPKVLQKFMPGAQGTLNMLFYVLLALWAGIIVLFSERNSLNPIKRLGKGLFTLYGVSGVLGDILSYSRLLALGLATGVIAGVMNTLAGMVKQIPIVGIVGFVGVLIVGHLFNLFISGLSAFVHSIRLQFMEFFTKFYTGEGELLKTFSEKRKYTQIKLQKN